MSFCPSYKETFCRIHRTTILTPQREKTGILFSQREFASDNAGNHWRDGDSDSKQDIARRLPPSRLNVVGSRAALALDTDLPRSYWKEKKHDQRYKYHRGDDDITVHPHSNVASTYRASASVRTCVDPGSGPFAREVSDYADRGDYVGNLDDLGY